MSVQFSNDAYGISVSSISATETQIEIGIDHWDDFPDLSGEHYCYLAIIPRGENKIAEIVKATEFGEGIFTVERGVDGTAAVAHRRGSRVAMRLVSASLYALREDAVTQSMQRVYQEVGGLIRTEMSGVFSLMLEQLSGNEQLIEELPIRSGDDELTEDNLNAQAVHLNQKILAIRSVIANVAEQNIIH